MFQVTDADSPLSRRGDRTPYPYKRAAVLSFLCEGEKLGFTVEKPSKHYFSQVLKVKTESGVVLTACALDTMG